jgi:hypothetical protein
MQRPIWCGAAWGFEPTIEIGPVTATHGHPIEDWVMPGCDHFTTLDAVAEGPLALAARTNAAL